MEVVKKQIQLVTTTAATECVSGDCFQIIADTGVTYNLKIKLEKAEVDYGFFDAIDIDETVSQTTSNQQGQN